MKGKIDTVEKLAIIVADGFEGFTHRFDAIDERFEAMDRRFDAIDTQLHTIHAEITDIHRRLDRLEAQGASHAGFAKEIDYLLQRVAVIERHLKLKTA